MEQAFIDIIQFHQALPAFRNTVEALLERLTVLPSPRDVRLEFNPDELLILAHELDLEIVGDSSFFGYEERLARKEDEPRFRVKLSESRAQEIAFRCITKYAYLMRKEVLDLSAGDTLFYLWFRQEADDYASRKALVDDDRKHEPLTNDDEGGEPKRKTRERAGYYTSMPDPYFNWYRHHTTAELSTAAADRNRRKVYAELKRLCASGEIKPECDDSENIPKTIRGAMWGPEAGLLILKKLLSDWLKPDEANVYAQSLFRLYQKPIFSDDVRARIRRELCHWIHPDR